MTDEHEHAMKVWREACGESQEAFYRIGEQPNDPESIKQGQLADQAVAAVIAVDRAGLVAEIERLREALGEICRDSNPDWTEKRVYPTDVLDDIHKIAVEAYYFRAALKEPSHDA